MIVALLTLFKLLYRRIVRRFLFSITNEKKGEFLYAFHANNVNAIFLYLIFRYLC